MKTDVRAPSVGESITEVSILKWKKGNGEAVKKGEPIVEIESDKATVEVVADSSGALLILKQAGEKIPINEIIGSIDDSVAGKAAASVASAPAKAETPTQNSSTHLSPAVKKMVDERGVDPSQISGTGKDGRLTKGDVLQYPGTAAAAAVSSPAPSTPPSLPSLPMKPGDRRVPMTRLRAKIAERLVYAQHTAAILTTFNECDLTAVMELRTKYKEKFQKAHGVSLSFMSFFTRACAAALQKIPEVNAAIDGNDVIYHDYQDIGIAVGTERGLVVPVLFGAGKMGFVEIEQKIGEMAKKARDGKLSIADMSGGTFTISNGGTYGSLLSTPILNPPQSAILGMHKIMDRPIAVEGKIEIRPMMYLALSYDHRLIDGKGAVTFLIHVKEGIEKPETLGLEELRGLK